MKTTAKKVTQLKDKGSIWEYDIKNSVCAGIFVLFDKDGNFICKDVCYNYLHGKLISLS